MRPNIKIPKPKLIFHSPKLTKAPKSVGPKIRVPKIRKVK